MLQLATVLAALLFSFPSVNGEPYELFTFDASVNAYALGLSSGGRRETRHLCHWASYGPRTVLRALPNFGRVTRRRIARG
jgi:hypothetical protein